eukprot:s3755_g5.t1
MLRMAILVMLAVVAVLPLTAAAAAAASDGADCPLSVPQCSLAEDSAEPSTLSGPLVANTCNHVFHRDCLHAASTCRQCSKKICHEKALSLYNLSFADGDGDARVMTAVAELKRKRESREDVVASEDELEDEDLETEALALQDAGSSQCGTPTTEDNAVKEAAELVLLRQKLSELRDRVQTAKSSREKAVEYREQQQSRFRTVQHAVEKQEADVAKIKAGVKNAYQERDKISEQLQKVSLRDAVVEYWQVLRESPAKALETLTTYVSYLPALLRNRA